MLTSPDVPEETVLLSTLKVLRGNDIAQIEAVLKKIGPFGEVHLIVEKGRLRYIRTVEKENAIEVRPS